ncbi:MAG: TrmH family RNA methyltransferase [Hyphomicrobiales bacterium]
MKPPITSLQNPTIKLIRSLAEKKYREETGLFVAEGAEVLARARREGWVPTYLVSTAAAGPWGKAERLAVAEKVMQSLSAQRNASSALGVFKQRFADRIEPKGVWIALEEMRDPGNLGSIVRTADAVAAEGVIVVGAACDPYSRECVRASMGSIFGMPIARLAGGQFIGLCRSWPGDVIGTHLQATEDYRRTYNLPALLVMGSEGHGLSDGLAAACSTLVRIPMKGGAESLNVAVAAGLMLYEIGRGRKRMWSGG